MSKKAITPAMVDGWFRACGFTAPAHEYRFAPPRRWRFDYAWPEYMIALEVEGGVFVGGRHTRGAGFVKDMEKYNEATARGWRVFRTTPRELLTNATAELMSRCMGAASAAERQTP